MRNSLVMIGLAGLLLIGSWSTSVADHQGWGDYFGPPPLGSGANARGTCLGQYRGALIAGGFFTQLGSVPVQNVGQWIGFQWDSMDGGLSGLPEAFLEYDDLLYAGGYFSGPGGVPFWRLATWNGSQWSPICDTGGASDIVLSFANYRGDLIVAGVFTSLCGESFNDIARWDGEAWHPLGDGTRNPLGDSGIWDLVVWNDLLIAAGKFTEAGGDSALHIAAWDGTSWTGLGGGITGCASSSCPPFPNALEVYSDQLYVGGLFTHVGADSLAARSIAMWTGTTWQSLGEGIHGEVTDLATYAGKLFVTGSFDSAGSIPAPNIACWDGSQWTVPGGGLHLGGNALHVLEDALFVTGDLDSAGGHASTFLGVYHDSLFPASVSEHQFTSEEIALAPRILASSNPIRGPVLVSFFVPVTGTARFGLFDVRGRAVRSLAKGTIPVGWHEIHWDGHGDDGRALPGGIYFLTLQSGGHRAVSKIVIGQ